VYGGRRFLQRVTIRAHRVVICTAGSDSCGRQRFVRKAAIHERVPIHVEVVIRTEGSDSCGGYRWV
jgi:hypothetical protein